MIREIVNNAMTQSKFRVKRRERGEDSIRFYFQVNKVIFGQSSLTVS